MNSDRFVTERVHPSLPCDLKSVASITGEAWTEENKPWLRLVAFCMGGTACNVGRLLKEATRNSFDELTGLALSVGDNEEYYLLWLTIIKVLAKKNSALLKSLFSLESDRIYRPVEQHRHTI